MTQRGGGGWGARIHTQTSSFILDDNCECGCGDGVNGVCARARACAVCVCARARAREYVCVRACVCGLRTKVYVLCSYTFGVNACK